MHTGRNYTLREVVLWTRRETYVFIVIAAIPTALYFWLDWKWMTISWLPVALVGTAVAFVTGFKNNASYERTWEARKVWGAIVNTSRTWGIMVLDFVTTRHAAAAVSAQELRDIHRRLIYRHIAWLTALRYQLRQPKDWEMAGKAHTEYMEKYEIVELTGDLRGELSKLLSAEEVEQVLGKANAAAQLIALQSKDLRELLDRGLIEDFRHMELENQLADMYVEQGKSERIKNFPYPRQFATLNLLFVWLFICLVPFGLLDQFDDKGRLLVWLTVPFSVLIAWVFHTMDKIGEATENPFGGTANDVPITALSRTIEIDLREMLDEQDIPPPIQAVNLILS